MSLISTYVIADDGRFYKNPVLGEKDWFICFDDDEPPELVIKKESGLSYQDIFKKIGLKYSHIEKQKIKTLRMFGVKYIFSPANSYFFKLKSPIPNKYIIDDDGTITDINEIGEGVIFNPKK